MNTKAPRSMSDLEAARFAKDRLIEAMDNWPDDMALNKAFNDISLAYDRLKAYIDNHSCCVNNLDL